MKKRLIFGSVALIVIVAAVLGISLYNNKGNLKPETARTKVENFVNTYLMQNGSKVTISDVTEAYGLYKVKVNIGADQKVDSYVSRDGKLFFPQALDMDELSKTPAGEGAAASGDQAAAPVDVPKTDKPVVELFVMTHCPYGTQMEKGILPVTATLGKKIDFSIKFNDYAMHGEKELDQSLIQYCVQKEQNDKYTNYLTCFLKDESQTTSCLASAKVDTNKMQACVDKTDKAYSVKDNFKNNKDFRGTFPGFNVQKEDNTKYGVGGSPTLIINGKDVSTARDSASLLKAICSAFKDQPKECEATLSSAAPSAGFGEGTAAGGSAAAGCGQ
jgi:hypothetical protein